MGTPAISRLDIGEVGALGAQSRPVDIGLPAGYVDAMHGKVSGRDPAEIHRLGITEAVAVNLQTLETCRRRHWLAIWWLAA